MTPRILCIPDSHFPYQHPNFFNDVKAHIQDFNPTHIVHMGDLVDFHSTSRHDPNPDAADAKTELKRAKDCVKRFIEIIPSKIDVRICIGNHDNRIEKRAAVNYIPKVFLKNTRELFNIPNHWKIADIHFITDICFVHGHSNLRGKTALSYGKNVVQGHFHSMLEISYHKTPTKLLWSVFTGSAANPRSVALAYNKNSLSKDIYGYVRINKIPQIYPGSFKN